ncbi:hypothetical protein D3C87_1228580 [compost metagenome]
MKSGGRSLRLRHLPRSLWMMLGGAVLDYAAGTRPDLADVGKLAGGLSSSGCFLVRDVMPDTLLSRAACGYAGGRAILRRDRDLELIALAMHGDVDKSLST